MNGREKRELQGKSDHDLLVELHVNLDNFKLELDKYYRTKQDCSEYRSILGMKIAKWSGGIGALMGLLSALGLTLGILWRIGIL